MSDKTQTDMLITTLQELRDEEREHLATRLRLRLKPHVRRFIQRFGLNSTTSGLFQTQTCKSSQRDEMS